MATRNRVAQSSKISNEEILSVLKSFPDTALTPNEIAGELESDVTETEVFNILNTMEDAGSVSGEGRGLTSKWSIGGTVETPVQPPVKPKRTRRTKAEMEAARAEERKRTEYNARVAETQDMDMSHAAPAVSPVKDEKGENITVPVDFDDPSKGRRELDADKGERVIGETTFLPSAASLLGDAPTLTIPAPVQEVTVPKTVTLELHEPKNGPCPGVELPECPEWCPVNVWELAHDANTESARKYWGKRVAQYQADAQPNYGPESTLTDEERAEVPY